MKTSEPQKTDQGNSTQSSPAFFGTAPAKAFFSDRKAESKPFFSSSRTTVQTKPTVSLSRRSSSTIQRQTTTEVVITGISHLVEMKGKTIYGGKEKQEIIHGQKLVIDEDVKIGSRRGPNQEDFEAVDRTGPQHYLWYKVIGIENEKIDGNLYVREDVFVPLRAKDGGSSKLSKANSVVDAVTDVPATLIGNEGISGVADALNDKTIKTGTGGGNNATDSGKSHAANMGIVGDVITGGTGLLGLATGFQSVADPEADAESYFTAFLEAEQGGMKTAEATSKLVHTGSKSEDPTTASKFGSAFEGYGAAFAGIKEAFFAMKKIVAAIRKRDEYGAKEVGRKLAHAGVHFLEAAKSVVLSVKAFIELVEGAASGGLMAAVPGLDIAIAGAKMIMSGYYLAVSNASRKVMNERRKALGGEDKADRQKFVSASETYRKADAEISNRREVIRKDEKRLKKKGISQSEKERLEKRIKKLKNEISTLQAEEAANNIAREDVSEFSLATELRDANRKRVTRQSVHLSTEMANIAGSIAVLTGAGAIGGAVTKGAASAVELSLPTVRMAKQSQRDRAARKIVKGKADSSYYDHTKSTVAKSNYRLKQVKYLIRLIIEYMVKSGSTAKPEEETVINQYLVASGVNIHMLYQKNGDPQKQIKMLVDAIKTREF